MAAVPSASKQFLTIAGDKIFGCYTITGDAAGTTWAAPVAAIESAWFQRVDDSATSERMTWSGATVTFVEAPGSGEEVNVFFIGY